jgi:hypothetical protein
MRAVAGTNLALPARPAHWTRSLPSRAPSNVAARPSQPHAPRPLPLMVRTVGQLRAARQDASVARIPPGRAMAAAKLHRSRRRRLPPPALERARVRRRSIRQDRLQVRHAGGVRHDAHDVSAGARPIHFRNAPGSAVRRLRLHRFRLRRRFPHRLERRRPAPRNYPGNYPGAAYHLRAARCRDHAAAAAACASVRRSRPRRFLLRHRQNLRRVLRSRRFPHPITIRRRAVPRRRRPLPPARERLQPGPPATPLPPPACAPVRRDRSRTTVVRSRSGRR